MTAGSAIFSLKSGGIAGCCLLSWIRFYPASVKRDGEDGTVETTTAEIATLLAGGAAAGHLTITGSGDSQTLAVPGVVPLTGGGENCHSISQVQQIVSLLNATPAVTDLMTVTGSGSALVSAQASHPLSGGRNPVSVSDVADVVQVIQETPDVAAVLAASGGGNGPSVVTEADALALTGGRLSQSISQVHEIVGLLNSTPAVTALMSVTGSGPSVVSADSATTSLSGGRVEFHPAVVTQYAWDVPGRLASVTLGDVQTHRYDYDYRTRRIGTHQTATASSPVKHTAIVFSGGLSLAEYENSTVQTGISNASVSTVRYVRGPDMGGGVGGLLSSVRSGERKYNLSNGRGDIVAQSDASAALTWTASYEAYGKRTKETGTNTDKQRANSKDEDPTGLLNEGFRYRDIETGAWLSRDPAGFVDGPNLYAYVKQNPWTSFDPNGLAEKEIGHVYVEINHGTKEYYVGETQGPPAERMNHSEHQAKSLRDKEGTIAYSRTIVADDNPTTSSVKAQRMVVEREIQEHMAKEHPDYKSVGTQRLADEKYQLAKETTNPRLKKGEAPIEYESKKGFFSSKRSMVSIGEAKQRVPLGMKVAGTAGFAAIAIMFADRNAIADDMVKHVEDWRQAVAVGNNHQADVSAGYLAAGFTGQTSGPAAGEVLLVLEEARVRAQEMKSE